MHAAKPIVALLTLLSVACTAADDSQPVVNPHEAEVPASEDSAATPPALRFEAQPGWVTQTPSSSMRKAQYRLPGERQGTADASLVVYEFGGTAGSVESNMERWIGQFENPDGRAVESQRRTRAAGPFTLHEIDVAGTYVAETSPGSDEFVNEPDFRMLAAVAEAEGVSYYIKLVGPGACVDHWEASYQAFMSALFP
jgi:hypothetical protein